MTDSDWWKKAVFYQIYPRSFADGNGDGIGDIQGIIAKLDYLQDLGVDAIWLSPHFPSPLWDCGYDVADYTGVAPEYGNLDDFMRMLDGMHQRGIRLILDLVLNHTSDQHPWFLESRSSRDNPKRDWFIWRDGKEGGPPNNWYSTFGGSAWEYDEKTGQYFYHFFFKQQPDLNWRNPEVKQAMFDAVRFWLDRGVDGFRLDAIGTIFEDADLPDHKSTLTQPELYRLSRMVTTEEERTYVQAEWKTMFKHQHDLPGIHELMRDLRALVDEYPERVLVGETDLIEYYGTGEDELHLVFNFPLMRTERLLPVWIRANQQARLAALPADAWPCNTLGNHDSPRIFNRYGDGIHDAALARAHLALMLTLRGTPFLYNGEEIGMTDLLLEDIHQFRDMLGVWSYETEMEVLGSRQEAALVYSARAGRDKCRTPMQWRNAPNGGFSPQGVTPWLPVNPNFAEGINVEEQLGDPESLLNFYRRLLKVRRNSPALIFGEYQELHSNAAEMVSFLRSDPPSGQACLVVINLSEHAHTINFKLPARKANVLFSSRLRGEEELNLQELFVAPYETFIGELLNP